MHLTHVAWKSLPWFARGLSWVGMKLVPVAMPMINITTLVWCRRLNWDYANNERVGKVIRIIRSQIPKFPNTLLTSQREGECWLLYFLFPTFWPCGRIRINWHLGPIQETQQTLVPHWAFCVLIFWLFHLSLVYTWGTYNHFTKPRLINVSTISLNSKLNSSQRRHNGKDVFHKVKPPLQYIDPPAQSHESVAARRREHAMNLIRWAPS